MTVTPGQMHRCDHEGGCQKESPAHKWGQMKATKEGWFFSKDGKAFCPDHIPAWVAGWRERRKKSAEERVQRNLDDLIDRYAAEDGLTKREWVRKAVFSAVCRRFIQETRTYTEDDRDMVAP